MGIMAQDGNKPFIMMDIPTCATSDTGATHNPYAKVPKVTRFGALKVLKPWESSRSTYKSTKCHKDRGF